MPGRALVLNANILVRAVLGNRARQIIETYTGSASFFIPQAAYQEAEEHVAALVVKRGGDPHEALTFLRALAGAAESISADVYCEYEMEARERLPKRDPEDWPILASARSRSGARSGLRILTSSAAAWRPGHPIASRCSVVSSSEGL